MYWDKIFNNYYFSGISVFSLGKCKLVQITRSGVYCKTVGFFSQNRFSVIERLYRVSLSVFSLAPDLLFDCSRVVEYAKIRTVLIIIID